MCPKIPSPLLPSLTVLFSPFHSCIPTAISVGDGNDSGWFWRDEKCYSIIPNTPEMSIFFPKSLCSKFTLVASSAKMRRHTSFCFTHLLHCTALCTPSDVFRFSNPTKLTATWFKSQFTILTVLPFALKMEYPLILLPDQKFHPWPQIFWTWKCYRLRSSSLCQLRSRNGW